MTRRGFIKSLLSSVLLPAYCVAADAGMFMAALPRMVPPSFGGNPNVTITAIDASGGIVASRTSGQTPCFIQVSASAITATGTSVPYEDLEYSWNFGDSAGTELIVNPTNNNIVNANAQSGP